MQRLLVAGCLALLVAACGSSKKTRRVEMSDDDAIMGTGIESADVEAMAAFAKSLIAPPELTGPGVQGVPTVAIGGKDYGMGSSRDWAAKGTRLLGVRAVIAESFERIHRSNLVGMGVLPLQFEAGASAQSLGLDGREEFDIHVDDHASPGARVAVEAVGEDGAVVRFEAICRLDTPVDVEYYRGGGILQTVLRRLLK